MARAARDGNDANKMEHRAWAYHGAKRISVHGVDRLPSPSL